MTTFTTAQAAVYVGWHPSTIRNYINTGRLAAEPWGGTYRIEDAALAPLIEIKRRRQTTCRNGHDLTAPEATWTHPNMQGRRCRQCLADSNRRWYLRRHGREAPFYLQERHPQIFKQLRAEIRDLLPYPRLATALRFWECLA